MHLIACLVFGAMAVAGPAWSQIYKWVDAQGVTHYAQSPPPASQGKASQLNVPESQAETPGRETDWQAQEQQLKARLAKQADARKQAEDKADKDEAARHRACLQARASLDMLGRQMRIYNVNEQGEKIYLSDDDRALKIQQANQAVAQNCNT